MASNGSSQLGEKLGIFGYPNTYESAQLIIIPVPWEVTTSYGAGTSMGPEAILEASTQVDLFDLEVGDAYLQGYHMLPIPSELLILNRESKAKALKWQSYYFEHEIKGEANPPPQRQLELLEQVNADCEKMVAWVRGEAEKALAAGKFVAAIGGDHSTPLGLIQAIGKKYPKDLGVLHIDAHADLRRSYQGFRHSHASIMYNVATDPHAPQKLVQIGIRDFCQEEFEFSRSQQRIKTFYDYDIKKQLFRGKTWHEMALEVIAELPQHVYVSFDVDGLSADFCPQTGTPVPGGLSFDQALYLFTALADSGRKIVGFDINEVVFNEQDGSEWDANVGARLLYKLAGWTMVTNGLARRVGAM